ncbi:MAG: YfhL family 4Fe-4S dicluster ferredoxin [Deltaproteobacteria bacterium]|nr:YfhL family 4Fe-4S dicluster ferredoxin [Deltaproteobacteria bacterium]
MATMIASDCINCGACEPECPNNAISQGDPIFVIDPILCTECVGFHDYEACAAVCPVDVCITDPKNIESEEALIARARTIHPETNFGDSFQSRFRKGSTAPVATAVAPTAPAVGAAPVGAAKPVAAAAAAKLPPKVAAPKPVALKQEPRAKKTFTNEVAGSFADVSTQFTTGAGTLTGLPRLAAILLQPVIGAFPHRFKKRLEVALQSSSFTAAGSTALNIVHNAVLYPMVALVIIAVAAGPDKPEAIFSRDTNIWVLVAFVLAATEGIFRLRDGIFHAKPADEMKFPGAIYGGPLSLFAESFFAKHLGLVRELPIPVDGFYSGGFVDKLERERRYGNVYTVEDRGGAYLVRLEFPRWVPEIGVARRDQMPDEMPDYDYDLALKDGQLVVKGKCLDENVRKISSSVGAFPPEFTTIIPFQQRISGFAHQFGNKLLEVMLVKA